ncbi:MAG: ABC transporter permease [Chloroflexi bacterium]|nr:ABC transporter permease [Chloroflexota bacterium]
MTGQLWSSAGVRLIRSVAVVFGVVTIVFFMSRAVGDPVSFLAPIESTAAEIEAVKDELGLNDPLPRQYGRFLAEVAQLDFGQSFRANRPATDVVGERIWATVQLGVAALALAFAVGIPLGIVSAVRRGGVIDLLSRLLALFGQAVPNFWLGLILILFVAVRFELLPTGGRGGPQSIILPAITLASFPTAAIMRFTRSAMLDALQQDYIRTARAKGLTEGAVITRHALRNSLLAVVTLLGLQIGSILSGAIVVETVFAWPGLGRLIIQSIVASDYPVVQAAVVMTSVWIVAVNFLVDVSYSFLDPRIRAGVG